MSTEMTTHAALSTRSLSMYEGPRPGLSRCPPCLCFSSQPRSSLGHPSQEPGTRRLRPGLVTTWLSRLLAWPRLVLQRRPSMPGTPPRPCCPRPCPILPVHGHRLLVPTLHPSAGSSFPTKAAGVLGGRSARPPAIPRLACASVLPATSTPASSLPHLSPFLWTQQHSRSSPEGRQPWEGSFPISLLPPFTLRLAALPAGHCRAPGCRLPGSEPSCPASQRLAAPDFALPRTTKDCCQASACLQPPGGSQRRRNCRQPRLPSAGEVPVCSPR